jgi:hypothetical protein
MIIKLQRVTCADCHKVSDVEIVCDAPLAVSIASMKAARCPHCGGCKLGIGGELDGKPDLSSPVENRAAWWLANGSVGLSSRTLYGVFTGDMPHELTVPLDPDDFSRCKRLFDLIPEWRADLAKVKQVLPWYGPLIDQWTVLESLFATEESNNWEGPHVMYQAMHPLVTECRNLQYKGRCA